MIEKKGLVFDKASTATVDRVLPRLASSTDGFDKVSKDTEELEKQLADTFLFDSLEGVATFASEQSRRLFPEMGYNPRMVQDLLVDAVNSEGKSGVAVSNNQQTMFGKVQSGILSSSSDAARTVMGTEAAAGKYGTKIEEAQAITNSQLRLSVEETASKQKAALGLVTDSLMKSVDSNIDSTRSAAQGRAFVSSQASNVLNSASAEVSKSAAQTLSATTDKFSTTTKGLMDLDKQAIDTAYKGSKKVGQSDSLLTQLEHSVGSLDADSRASGWSASVGLRELARALAQSDANAVVDLQKVTGIVMKDLLKNTNETDSKFAQMIETVKSVWLGKLKQVRDAVSLSSASAAADLDKLIKVSEASSTF
jgi:hypothetical protein